MCHHKSKKQHSVKKNCSCKSKNQNSETNIVPVIRQQIRFISNLNGANEVPSTGSSATGTLVAVLSKDQKSLTFSLQTQGLKNITVAHFHHARQGVSGPVVRPININQQTGTASGVWTSTDAQPLTPELVQALLKGHIYINVHTVHFTNGEIRGQLFQI